MANQPKRERQFDTGPTNSQGYTPEQQERNEKRSESSEKSSKKKASKK